MIEEIIFCIPYHFLLQHQTRGPIMSQPDHVQFYKSTAPSLVPFTSYLKFEDATLHSVLFEILMTFLRDACHPHLLASAPSSLFIRPWGTLWPPKYWAQNVLQSQRTTDSKLNSHKYPQDIRLSETEY